MWLLGVLQKKVSLKIHKETPALKSLHELQAIRLATLLKRHLRHGQKQPLKVFFLKMVFLEISQNSQEDTSARVSPACNFIKKENLAQVFSCEFCEISKNTFFTEHL